MKLVHKIIIFLVAGILLFICLQATADLVNIFNQLQERYIKREIEKTTFFFLYPLETVRYGYTDLANNQPLLFENASEGIIKHTIFSDNIYRQPVSVAGLTFPGEIYQQGKAYFKVALVIIIILVFLLLVHLLFSHLSILKRPRGSIPGKNGLLNYMQNYMLDISERRKIQEKIEYLSFHDQLTGLYNRFYLEETLPGIDIKPNLPLSIIVLDVNGLKLINDTLGHNQGDELLVRVAQAVIQSCRQGDIICRWGGDEYLIILPRTDEEAANNIVERIKESCDSITIQGLQTSSSIGFMTKTSPEQNLAKILKEAEEKMYRNKLFHRNSIRNAVIRSLETSLRAKNFETKEHSDFLAEMLINMGKMLNFPGNKLDELRLLADIHDIGMIAIPHEILFKPGPLSEEEWSVVKKHSEIGYRVAKSSPELDILAEAILCHHERWDGTGYPLGLTGNDIPLFSRMLAIAHAYDTMTRERPYKKKLSPQEAIAELRYQAGKQFDPYLVDTFISSLIGPADMLCLL